ncbi:DUF6266 family protein [Carboxylicivirga sp. N1Y90]|uniref:DUF6266 family protein n=1 Tax=Carboxylicivirga fragile TaxID=3417571 RepID=UPI003D33E5B2|nr:hypothetical protein [Marinilabiliaceae bacterium N1Y90]
MARYNINDGSSGKIGSVVTYQMYGKSYVRSLPSQYKDKKSVKQLAQRQKMSLVNEFLSPYKDVLKICFQQVASGCSAYAAAKSYNLLNSIYGEFPNQYIDFTKALVSMGSVPLPTNTSIERTHEGLLLQWSKEDSGSALDTLFMIANVRGQYIIEYKQTEARRRDCSYLWKIDSFGNEKYDIWLVFRDYKERGFSNSKYLGTI